MEYAKDLLKEKVRSRFPLILGLVSFGLAIFWIVLKGTGPMALTTFDWVYAFLFLLNGVSHTSYGLGYSLERLVGRAYIRIDNRVIKIKTGVLDQEQKIEWPEIAAIDYKPGYFIMTRNDRSTCKLSMKKLEYSVIQEIKMVMGQIAKEKEIPIDVS